MNSRVLTKSRAAAGSLCIAVVIATTAAGASASPLRSGALDPSWGNGGIVSTSFANSPFPFALGVANVPGGVVAVGVAQNKGGKGLFGVARYQRSGSLAPGFGNGAGEATTDFGLGGDNLAAAVAVQRNGKIVVVGYAADTSDNNYYWAIARYNANGKLDRSFGNNGKVITTFGLTYDFANAVAIRSDGKIVVAGSAGTHNGSQYIALARYNSNGSLDYTFGAGGTVLTQVGTAVLSIAHGVALANGIAYVAGYTGDTFSATQPILAAYNASGTLDASFGTGGIQTFTLSTGSNDFNAVVVHNQTVVAAGEASSNNGDFLAAEVNLSGRPISSFGTHGLVTIDFTGGTDTAYGVGVDGHGRVVLAGDSFSTSDQVALARLHADGRPDATFGTSGKVLTTAGAGGAAAYAMTFTSSTRILVGGITLSAGQTSSRFLLARYVN